VADTPLVAAPPNQARARLAPWFPLGAAGSGGALLLSALAHLHTAAVAGTDSRTASRLGQLSLVGATVGVTLCLVALWARRRRPGEQLVHAVLALALVALGLDGLAVTLVTGSLERTLDVALAVVAAGGLLPDRRWSLGVVATLGAGWLVVAAAVVPTRATQCVGLLAALAAAAATRELRRPTGRRRPRPGTEPRAEMSTPSH